MTAFKKISSPLVDQQVSKSYQIESAYDEASETVAAVSTGHHLIADFYGASQLNDIKLMEDALTKATELAGATLLHIHIHTFALDGS